MERMRTVRLLAVLFITLVLTVPASAMDPVDPPFEGYGITSSTDLNVLGDMTHNENFNHENCDGTATVTVDDEDVYTAPINHGQILYVDENNAYDGTTDFVKSFAASTHPDPGNDNLTASKDVSFITSGTPTGVFVSQETGDVRLINTNGFQHNVVHQNDEDYVCILADESERDTALGSTINATVVGAHTNTNLNLYSGDVTASHSIEASGQGTVSAEMITLYREHDWRVVYDDGCDVAGTHVDSDDGSAVMNYRTSALASGTFAKFNKSMATNYPVKVTSTPAGGLPGLCPWHQE